MSLTAWKTWASGDILTAADMNTYVRDNGRWLSHNATNGAPACRVYNSAAESITSGVYTALTFDSERFDIGAMHDPVTNNSRITIPASSGGKYLIGAGVAMATSTLGNARGIEFRVNGSTLIAVLETAPYNRNELYGHSTLYAMAAADYAEVLVFQDSGGALNINASSNFSPEFWAIWMGE